MWKYRPTACGTSASWWCDAAWKQMVKEIWRKVGSQAVVFFMEANSNVTPAIWGGTQTRFFDFQDGGRPPSWICWNRPHEKYISYFRPAKCHNMTVLIFSAFGLKTPIYARRLFLGQLTTSVESNNIITIWGMYTVRGNSKTYRWLMIE